MFTYLYNLFFPSREKQISKEIKKKYEQAIDFQRNGNIRAYSSLMNEIANLEDELHRLRK